MSTQEQIVIIGGGIMGVSTAYFLVNHPQFDSQRYAVTVIEGTRVAAAASGKAGGLLAKEWHGPSTSQLARVSYRLHAELAEKHGGSKKVEGEGAGGWGYRELDTFNVRADLRSPVEVAKKVQEAEDAEGSEVELEQEEEQKAKALRTFPDSLHWLDQTVLRDAQVIGTKSTTAQIHPWLFTSKFLALAQEKGVKFVLGTVDSLKETSPSQRDGNSPTHWTVSGSLLPTPESPDASTFSLPSISHVVIAAGPWTGALLHTLFPTPSLIGGRARQITGHRAHSVVFKPPKDHALPLAIFTTLLTPSGDSEPEIYSRPDATVYACGPTDASPLPEKASDVQVEQKAIEILKAQMEKLSPEYLKAEVVLRQQACYLPVFEGFREKTEPVIGKIEEGLYVASGHGCWGILNGPGTGACMAELILEGQASSVDLEPFKR